MKSLHQTYTIDAPVEEVWDCLVTPSCINEWGGGPSVMDDTVGKDFSLWGGDIYGTNTDVEQHHKLVQDWYAGKWEEPSEVTFTLHPHGEKTIIDLVHNNIPDDELESISEGWHEYYLGAMKHYLESQNE